MRPDPERLADTKILEDLNLKIGDAENRGDRKWLEGILAPRLAFQRADPARTVDTESQFLEKLKPGGNRVTRIESIRFYGERAIVTCIVAVGGQSYHNLRLFVRREGDWKLLGWANEPSPAP